MTARRKIRTSNTDVVTPQQITTFPLGTRNQIQSLSKEPIRINFLNLGNGRIGRENRVFRITCRPRIRISSIPQIIRMNHARMGSPTRGQESMRTIIPPMCRTQSERRVTLAFATNPGQSVRRTTDGLRPWKKYIMWRRKLTACRFGRGSGYRFHRNFIKNLVDEYIGTVGELLVGHRGATDLKFYTVIQLFHDVMKEFFNVCIAH